MVILGAGSTGHPGKALRLGHFAALRWHHHDDRLPEVFIGGEGLRRGAVEVLGTLLHEAAHGLADVRGIKDTSRQGRWHNTRFKNLADELGITVTKDPRIGWSPTAVPEATQHRYASTLTQLGAALRLYRAPEPTTAGGGKNQPTALCLWLRPADPGGPVRAGCWADHLRHLRQRLSHPTTGGEGVIGTPGVPGGLLQALRQGHRPVGVHQVRHLTTRAQQGTGRVEAGPSSRTPYPPIAGTGAWVMRRTGPQKTPPKRIRSLIMSGETTITIVGNLTDHPNYATPPGAAVGASPSPPHRGYGTATPAAGGTGTPCFCSAPCGASAAENAAASLAKGSRVILSGRLRQRSYDTADGEKRTVVEVEVDESGRRCGTPPPG